MSEIIEQLKWRYACKEFDKDKKISDEDFNVLLESLQLTASSYGLQPWKFVIVENQQTREELVVHSWNQRQVSEASHLIVMCIPDTIDEEFIDKYLSSMATTRDQDIESLEGFKKMLMMVANKSDADKELWAKKQVYIALGNLLTTCAVMNIDSCPMEGFLPQKYDEVLGLKELGLKSVLVCPVGYRSSNDKYADLKKVRYTLDELIIKK